MQNYCIIQFLGGLKSFGRTLKKISLAMKLLFILLICSAGLAYASDGYAQKTSITLNVNDCTIEEVLLKIERESGFSFFINSKNLNLNRRISVSASGKDIFQLLEQVFAGVNVKYKILDNKIVLAAKEAEKEQQKGISVKGSVKDKSGEPLIGVTIMEKGTTNGAITDIDGNYKITVKSVSSVLVFSYVGYQSQELSVKGRTQIDVTLQDDTQKLNEVVVTALGLKRETKALTYNVQQLNADDMKVKDINVMNSLAGKVAGVNINASSAGIGGGTRVVMRGTKSIFGNNNALYVVDGIPMPDLSAEAFTDKYSGAGQSGDGIANINSEDIESISVLSGSAAAALYGSSAANGVVLITTKKGAVEKTSLTYSNNSAFYSPFMLPKFQNRYGSEAGEWYSWGNKMSAPSNHNVKEFMQTGYNEANTLTLTTGNEKNQLYASVGVVNARGIIHNNDVDRYNFSFRNTTNMLDSKLHLDLGFMYSNTKEQNMLAQGEYGNPLVPLYLFPRGDDLNKYKYYERYDFDRNIMTQFWPLLDNGLSMQNPYWVTNRNMYNNDKNRYIVNASAKYNITDWLDFSVRFRMDRENVENTKKMYASTLTFLSSNSTKGAYMQGNQSTNQTYADAMFNVNKYLFDDKLNITAVLGTSILDLQHKEMSVGGGLLTIPNLFNIANLNKANYLSLNGNGGYHDRTHSIFGTVSFGYKSTVYLDTSLRNDWLSALAGTNHSSILYPSVGLSTIVSNLFDVDPSILSYAKVRVSYSEVGNAPKRHKALTTYPVDGGLGTTSYFPIKNLEPERTHSWEAGFNLAFFDNRLTMDLTAYRSYTENQLFNPAISSTTGFSSIYINAGKVSNKGVEFALGYKDKFGDLGWKSTLLWTLNRNKIDQLLPEYTSEELGVTVKISELDAYNLGGVKEHLQVGGSMGDLYVNTMRTDEHGKIWIDSQSSQIQTRKNHYVYAGNTNPKYNLSWRNDFNWKGFNLGFMVTARVGGVGVSATQAVMDYYGVSETTALARDKGRVTINGLAFDPQQWYQTVGSNGTDFIGSMYVYSMTNVRLGEVTLGYTFPIKKWCPFVKNLSLQLFGNNLLMLYCKAPFDPESTASTGTYFQGIDYFMQPSLKSLGFSAKVTF